MIARNLEHGVHTMSYKRLTIISLSVFLLITIIIIFGYKSLVEDRTFLVSTGFFIVLLIYILVIAREEYLNINRDKAHGVQKRVLKLYEYKIHYKGPRDNMPPIPIATFLICGTDKYITLSGDFSKVQMNEGKYYYVRYYENSQIMISIRGHKAARL